MAASKKTDHELFAEAFAAVCPGLKMYDPTTRQDLKVDQFHVVISGLAARATDHFYSTGMAKPEFTRIIAGVIDYEGIDACAFPGEDVYCVALSWGIQCQLFDLFRRLALRNEFLPGMGDPTPDRPPSKAESVVLSRQTCFMAKGRGMTDPPSMPADPIRQRLLEHLTIGATIAIFTHEVAHIALGHFNYRKQTGGSRVFQEFSIAASNSVKENLISHLFETEADENATYSVLSHFLAPDGSPVAGTGASSSREALMLALISLDTLFWVLGRNVAPEADWAEVSDHPPLFIRRMNATGYAERRLKALGLDGLLREFGEGGVASKVLDTTENLTTALYGETSNLSIWRENEAKITAYAAQLWEIKKELNPHREEWALVRFTSN